MSINDPFGISSDSFIQLANDTTKTVGELKKGDVVRTPNGEDTVLCVVRMNVSQHMSDFGSFRISAGHPMRIPDAKTSATEGWVYPKRLCENSSFFQGESINVILMSSPTFFIGEFEVSALAHGLQGEVIGHHYFCTSKIAADLAFFRTDDFEQGNVHLGHVAFRRGSFGVITGVENAE